MQLKKIKHCIFCKQKHFTFVASVKNSYRPFSIYRCTACGLYFQNPIPTKQFLKKFYESIYQKKCNLPSAEMAFEQKDEKQESMRIRKIEQFVKGGKLLDVGASSGFFLSEVKKRSNWRIYGIEYAKEAARIANKQYQLQLIEGELETAKLPNNYFDVITMHSVLEHISSPVHAIKIVWKKLKRNGLFVFNVPNLHSFEFCLFTMLGRTSPGFIFEHLYYFTPGLVKNILSDNGFVTLDITSRHYSTLRLPPRRPVIGVITFLPKLFLEYTDIGGSLKIGNILYVYAKKID